MTLQFRRSAAAFVLLRRVVRPCAHLPFHFRSNISHRLSFASLAVETLGATSLILFSWLARRFVSFPVVSRRLIRARFSVCFFSLFITLENLYQPNLFTGSIVRRIRGRFTLASLSLSLVFCFHYIVFKTAIFRNNYSTR